MFANSASKDTVLCRIDTGKLWKHNERMANTAARGVHRCGSMSGKLCLGLALASFMPVFAAQMALLGMNYSETIPTGSLTSVYSVAAATDSLGAIYVLETGVTYTRQSQTTSYLLKLTPAGNQVVYQTVLTISAISMAVDPAGNVYLSGTPACTTTVCPYVVEKLGTDGKTVMYTATIAPDAALIGIAVDSDGRAYVVGTTVNGDLATTPGVLQPGVSPATNAGQEFVVRLKSTGVVDWATYYGGAAQAFPIAIAVDASGSAFVTGFSSTAAFPTTPGAYLASSGIPNFNGAPYLMRLSPDGSSLVYSTFANPGGYAQSALALDSADNATVALNTATGVSTVMRFNPEGTATIFSKVLSASVPDGVVVDGADNTYALMSAKPNFPAQNSVAPCGTGGATVLAILDPGGDLLQSTYIGGSQPWEAAVGVGANSSVYVISSPDASYAPTQQLAGVTNGLLFIENLSPSANAGVLQLACIGNAASYDSSGISGGEIVSLFGQGLGPATGTQPQVEQATGFPHQLAGVQVTFNGIPGPLLYVQDGQINAIAPWALPASGTVSICVVYNGVTTNCIARPAVSEHPGVFTVDGSYAVALNQDGSVNSAANPAQIGSTVSIFATGLGPISPAQPDGAIVGMPLPVNVLADDVYYLDDTMFIGVIAVGAQVSYAGPAPFEVAGFSQVNFVAGDNSGPYGPFPYILQAGGTPSEGAIIEPGSNGFLVHIAGVAEN